MSAKIRVLLAEDQTMLRGALAALLELPADRGPRPRARPTVGARVPAPVPISRLDLGASAPVRSARPRSARAPRPPRRALPQQLELLPHVEAYADVVIDDPAALLGGPTPPQDAPRVPVAPVHPVAPVNDARASRAAAPDPVARPGEEILRAAGGGVVLRRRRPPNPSGAPEGAAP